VKAFARNVALVAVVAMLIAFADPASRPTVGRVAVFAVAVAAAGGLALHLARRSPNTSASPFEPRAGVTLPPPVPTELAELVGAFRSMAGSGRVDAQLRGALQSVAESRLQRHGRSLDRPGDDAAVRTLLGPALLAAIRDREAPDDPDELLAALETL
jgi:hypothetical protein